MKTQADNCSETEAVGAIGRVKGHNPLDPYVSARGRKCTSRRRPLQYGKNSLVRCMCTSNSNLDFMNFIFRLPLRIKVQGSKA